jgi:hypothetical protein
MTGLDSGAFDLHANVAVRAGDRRRLEHLCRYVRRPPVAQDALTLTPQGHVLLRLRRPWRDGTRAIRFAPSELLEKLAALIPRPRANLLIHHGAFAPRGCCRESAARCPPAARGCPATDVCRSHASLDGRRPARCGRRGAHPRRGARAPRPLRRAGAVGLNLSLPGTPRNGGARHGFTAPAASRRSSGRRARW